MFSIFALFSPPPPSANIIFIVCIASYYQALAPNGVDTMQATFNSHITGVYAAFTTLTTGAQH